MIQRAPKGSALLLSGFVLSVLAACSSSDSDNAVSGSDIQVTTLSNRAELISGGDALVQVTVPGAAASGSVTAKAIVGLKVTVGDRDVTDAFVLEGDKATGLVTGLAEGSNTVTASADGVGSTSLVVTNAPRGGPVLSGPQPTPYYCATPTPQIASGVTPGTNASGLSGEATDEKCNIPTEYVFYYRNSVVNCDLGLPDPSPTVSPVATEVPAPVIPPDNLCFQPYDVNSPVPDDAVTVMTAAGAEIPFIVRVERGTLNRGIYDIAVLYDPAQPWTATSPQPQWAGKVVYQFGASTGQPRRQRRQANAWTNEVALRRGYMVVGNSMTDSSRNSNRVSMAETTMMMKEHIAEQYGPIKFTLGTGCSGGSINSNQNASIAPGQLDGVLIYCTYPDAETTGIEVGDCLLLVEAYQKPQWLNQMSNAGYTPEQINARKAAINGHPDQTGCHGWFNAFGSNVQAGNYNQRVVVDNASGAIASLPTPTNNCELPPAAIYDAQSNPGGVRCDGPTWAKSVWGVSNGAGLRVSDNEGVQYGLQALLDGAISAEEFVVINELVGGVDRDGNLVAERMTADADALPVAYRSGIVSSGANLAKLPIMDLRGWDDSALITPPGASAPPRFPIHFVWRSFSLRARIEQAAGDADNHVMWRYPSGLIPPLQMQFSAFLALDSWLTALSEDDAAGSIEERVRRTRPDAQASDLCYLSEDTTFANPVTDFAQCDADPFLKASASPRQVAGGPLTEDVFKCSRKAFDVADYGSVIFSADQLSRLQAVFDQGVCDWSQAGVGQQAAVSPLTFTNGPGGEPLAPATGGQ
ncbi:MAG: DUF6351 family protein [Burkholderiaceae bacterium]